MSGHPHPYWIIAFSVLACFLLASMGGVLLGWKGFFGAWIMMAVLALLICGLAWWTMP